MKKEYAEIKKPRNAAPKKIKLYNSDLFALVDAADFDYLNQFRWLVSKSERNVYARRLLWVEGKQVIIFMHRELLSAPKGVEVDHKNGEGLDNRRGNIRFCTKAQNQFNSRKRVINSSPHKGVRKLSRLKSKPWLATIMFKRKNYYLGYFATEREAALAYNRAAVKYFGEFAYINPL